MPAEGRTQIVSESEIGKPRPRPSITLWAEHYLLNSTQDTIMSLRHNEQLGYWEIYSYYSKEGRNWVRKDSLRNVLEKGQFQFHVT